MKEFVVYTLLRFLLFAATFAVIGGIWILAADSFPWFPVLVLSLLVSGVASYFLLNRWRMAFAARVEVRASRASQRFEQMRAKEDQD